MKVSIYAKYGLTSKQSFELEDKFDWLREMIILLGIQISLQNNFYEV